MNRTRRGVASFDTRPGAAVAELYRAVQRFWGDWWQRLRLLNETACPALAGAGERDSWRDKLSPPVAGLAPIVAESCANPPPPANLLYINLRAINTIMLNDILAAPGAVHNLR